MRSLNFIGRLNSTFLSEAEWNAASPDVLVFGTADFTHILPVWVERTHNFGGRPTDAVVLATMLALDSDGPMWSAEIATGARGQFTAALTAGDRYIDCRPSLLEPLIRTGAVRELRMKPALESALIPVNREWLEKLQTACGEQVYRFIERRPAASDPGREWADDLFDDDKGVEDSDTFVTLIDEGFEPERVRLVMETDDEMQGPGGVFLRWSGLNLGVPADVSEGFERMWEALGLDDELDAWLSDTVNESDGDAPRE
ncbi:hypothetical protein ACEN19_02075 [Corynebacterium auriscanis]|uniref:hypothetical protein n=1 Tax=Corynebacterium auriscanis TaxID=99807 RepID=UPI003CF1DEAD